MCCCFNVATNGSFACVKRHHLHKFKLQQRGKLMRKHFSTDQSHWYLWDVLQKHHREKLKSITTLALQPSAATDSAHYCRYIESPSCSFLLQVIAAAKRGFQASGFELNPWLVWYSRYKAWREGVHRSTSFHISDLWKVSETWLTQ